MAETTKTRRRLSKDELQNDDTRLTGIRSVVGYDPSNKAYTREKIDAADEDMKAKQEAERAALVAYNTARDNATEAEHTRHTLLLGGGDQVAAQFGKSSNEFQSLGLKKKNEYKRPVRRKKPTATES
jgi:1,4-alpha-glucan branching enzyme